MQRQGILLRRKILRHMMNLSDVEDFLTYKREALQKRSGNQCTSWLLWLHASGRPGHYMTLGAFVALNYALVFSAAVSLSYCGKQSNVMHCIQKYTILFYYMMWDLDFHNNHFRETSGIFVLCSCFYFEIFELKL